MPPLRLRIPDVQDPDLAVDASFGNPAELRFVGSADVSARAPLGELLDKVHAELIGKAAKEVVVDFRALDAMVPSCMNELIRWLGRVQDSTDDERYRIRIKINRSVIWQTHSVKALSCFDTSLVEIE